MKEQLLKLFKDLGIHHFVNQNEGKANYAERCIKTLINLIYRYLSHTQKEAYIEKLPDLVSSYNHTISSKICMAPVKFNKSNKRGLWWYMYWPKSQNVKPPEISEPKSTRFEFKVGDMVRITGLKNPFTKEFHKKCPIFKISKGARRDGILIYKPVELLSKVIKTCKKFPEKKISCGRLRKF